LSVSNSTWNEPKMQGATLTYERLLTRHELYL
jgi:hypothetical protein